LIHRGLLTKPAGISNPHPNSGGNSVEKLYIGDHGQRRNAGRSAINRGIEPVGTKIASVTKTQIHKKHENKTPLEGATMYALIVFTLGWPAPEPVGTFSRIEVCQATKVNMSQALADISMRCEKVSPLILTKSGVSAK
jgi:hypothetical protein